MMISFIVIGRNEGWKLKKCIQSIFEAVKYNGLKESEIIYVDSKSTDGSIEVAKSFNEIKVFSITGECNAAVARNIGAQEAKGDILFFIDGDMEVQEEFMQLAIVKDKLKYSFVTGHLDDYLYDYNDNFLGKITRTYKKEIPKEEQNIITCGGVFLVTKELWEKVGGMKTKYRRGQDLDFSTRITKYGVNIKRLPALIVKHHTISYNSEMRMWKNLINGYHIFPAMLFRDHFFSFSIWKRFLRSNYTAILLILAIFSLIFKVQLVFACYFIILTLRMMKNSFDAKISKNKLIYFSERLIYQIIFDLLFWISFVFYYPKSIRISYK